MTTVRVELLTHLRTLARVEGELRLEVADAPTVANVLDALESRYPMLRGTRIPPYQPRKLDLTHRPQRRTIASTS